MRESAEERDRFVRLAKNSTGFIGMAHVDGRVVYMNDAAREPVGLGAADITERVIADFFPPEEAVIVANEVLPAVGRDGHWASELRVRHFVTGEPIPVLNAMFPVTDLDGNTLGYGTVTRDFRAGKRAEEDMRRMNANWPTG
nr:PAS domain-containing protein [Methylobacterium sp. GC_Met_2]